MGGRAAITRKAIHAFEQSHPKIKVQGEYSDFEAYFNKLATEVAAGDAPDVITLGGAYPREYGDRGALLDLKKFRGQLDMSNIDPAALNNGAFSGHQYGVPTGVNTFCVVANPAVFKKAGVPLPNDDTWTWEDFARIAKEISDNTSKGAYGAADPTTADMLDVYSRQRGESLYTKSGKVNIGVPTLESWWRMTVAMRDDGSTPPAAKTAELVNALPERTLMGRGLAGMQVGWSNLLGALEQASGQNLKLLRMPGETTSERSGMWLQASQLYSISSGTEHPEQAAELVDFLINSPKAGKYILADRGIPANSEVLDAIRPKLDRSEVAQAQFIKRMTPLVGPPLIIGPTGSTDTRSILDRLNSEVLFGRTSIPAASKDFVSKVSQAISK